MNPLKIWRNETIGGKVVESLKKNNFQACFCKTGPEAVSEILKLIPSGASVGVGGSQTIMELGVLERLASQGNIILNHSQPGLDGAQKLVIRRQQLTCDVFLTGANAVTMDGKLVNTDAAGNRVAAMIFGPQKVIVVAGMNKVVKDLAAAEERIKSWAAPFNNKRLNTQNPCVKSGGCLDCQGPTRLCNVTTIISKRPSLTDFHVLLIGEDLGF